MRILLIFLVVFSLSCKKEAEKPRCYNCETTTTKYRSPWITGYPQEHSDKFESCTDVTGSKTEVEEYPSFNYRTITETKCTQQ